MKSLFRNFKWGLLSTAKINRMLIPAFKHSRKNSLLGVASRSQQKADEYAKQWNIQRAYGSYEEMLADKDIDMVYIGLPNHLHAEWTIKAVQAGKHVLCEKPLALTTDEVDAIIEAAKDSGKIVAEAFMYRHHRQTFEIKKLVESGSIGEVKFIRGSFSFLLGEPENIRWNKEYGGGCLWDVGCYPISFFRMLAGMAPEEIMGRAIQSASGVDASFYGQLHYPNGITGQFDSSFCLPSYTNVEIRGTEGTLLVPNPFRVLSKSKIILQRKNKEKAIKIPLNDLYLGEIEDLAGAVIHKKQPLISLEESRDNISTIQRLYQTAAMK